MHVSLSLQSMGRNPEVTREAAVADRGSHKEGTRERERGEETALQNEAIMPMLFPKQFKTFQMTIGTRLKWSKSAVLEFPRAHWTNIGPLDAFLMRLIQYCEHPR